MPTWGARRLTKIKNTETWEARGLTKIKHPNVRGEGTHKNQAPRNVRGKGTRKNKAPQREKQGDSRKKGTPTWEARGLTKIKHPETWEGRGLTKIKHPNVRGKRTNKNEAPQRESQGDSQKSSTPMESPFCHVHVVDPGSCWERISEYFLTSPEMRQQLAAFVVEMIFDF